MKKLIAQGFGPVKHSEIYIQKFNLFIGEQSIGKSTIAKLLTLFTDHLFIVLLFLLEDRAWKMMIEGCDLLLYDQGDYLIKYEEIEEDRRVEIYITHSSVIPEFFKGEQKITEKQEIFKTLMNERDISHINAFINMQDTKNADVLSLFGNSLYIPAERNVSTFLTKLLPVINLVRDSLPKTITRFLFDLNNARDKYAILKSDLLGITYKKEEDTDKIILDQERSIPLNMASSGIQSAVPLLLVVAYGVNYKEYASFVIEEPECNLFPSKQNELLQYLVSSILKEDRVLTITTHSPYLLSALNNYLYAGSIAKELSEQGKEKLISVLPSDLWLKSEECSVYSLGEGINDGAYCKNLIDSETGLIDYNSLDGISMLTSSEFSKMQRIYLSETRNKV